MVVEPSEADKQFGFRKANYTYPKKTYEKAVKGIRDHQADKESGRFDNTVAGRATVYIETREVSKWQRLDMTDAT